MSHFIRTRSLALTLVVLVAAASLTFTGCADSGGEPLGDGSSTLSLALTGLDPATDTVEIIVSKDGAVILNDTYQSNGGSGSRNYRLDPGDYDLDVTVYDLDGNPVATGKTTVTVGDGNNFAEIVLTPTAEDLGDLELSFVDPVYTIGTVMGDADAPEGGVATFNIALAETGYGDPAATDLNVFGTVSITDQFEEDVPFMDLQANDNGDGTWTLAVPTEWVGPANLTIEVMENGQVTDTTSKTIEGIPSAETQELIDAVAAAITINAETGTFNPLTEQISTSTGSITEEGINEINQSIALINDTLTATGMVASPELAADLARTLFVVAAINWGCAWKFTKCAAAAVACVACAGVCAKTVGLACLACLAKSCTSAYTKCKTWWDDCVD